MLKYAHSSFLLSLHLLVYLILNYHSLSVLINKWRYMVCYYNIKIYCMYFLNAYTGVPL